MIVVVVVVVVVVDVVAGGVLWDGLASQVLADAADGRLRIASEVGFFAFLGMVVVLAWRLSWCSSCACAVPAAAGRSR